MQVKDGMGDANDAKKVTTIFDMLMFVFLFIKFCKGKDNIKKCFVVIFDIITALLDFLPWLIWNVCRVISCTINSLLKIIMPYF